MACSPRPLIVNGGACLATAGWTIIECLLSLYSQPTSADTVVSMMRKYSVILSTRFTQEIFTHKNQSYYQKTLEGATEPCLFTEHTKILCIDWMHDVGFCHVTSITRKQIGETRYQITHINASRIFDARCHVAYHITDTDTIYNQRSDSADWHNFIRNISGNFTSSLNRLLTLLFQRSVGLLRELAVKTSESEYCVKRNMWYPKCKSVLRIRLGLDHVRKSINSKHSW